VIGAGNSTPALHVSSTGSADHGPLVATLAPRNPLAFLRDGDGIIGLGEAVRLEFSGPARITDAASAWRALVAASTVHDDVQLPGSGLVAFGSFAFADSSTATSVLVVPEVILGRRDGVSWITRVSVLEAGDEAAAGEVPPASERMASRHTLHEREPSTEHDSEHEREPRGREAGGDEAGRSPFAVALTPGHMSTAAYEAAVAAAVERIGRGEASKVVIARDLVGELPAGADLRVPIARLAEAYPQTFTFAVDGLIGASPETLVRVSGSTVTARVLAGTAARGADAATDATARAAITASPKDLAEHAFARDSVMAALASHASGLFASPAPVPLALPNLWHLASDVTGTLTDGSSSLDLVAALHPTAAVAGTPTDAALRIIAELEPFDRGRYAGPVGWVSADGDGEWAVALRCAQVASDGDLAAHGGTVRAFAGAGIVSDSDPARELAETELKLRPIVEAFGGPIS
jgi:menaquinone-specific isochorismate synthase